MADSLSPACTPLKRSYDICFNRWLESYLAVAAPPGQKPPPPSEARREALQQQAALYEEQCGASFREYQQCLVKGIKDIGIGDVLEAARTEEPLIRHTDTTFPG